MARSRQYHEGDFIQGGSTEHFYADIHYHGSFSPKQHRERHEYHGYHINSYTDDYGCKGYEDQLLQPQHTKHEQGEYRDMGSPWREAFTQGGRQSFQQHKRCSSECQCQCDDSTYHYRRHSSPYNQERKYWDITIPQRGQFSTVRRPSSPEQLGRCNSPECQHDRIYHDRRHSSPDDRETQCWDMGSSQRGQFSGSRRQPSPYHHRRYSSPEHMMS